MKVGDIWYSASDFGVVRRDLREYARGDTYPILVRHDATNRTAGADYDYRAWADTSANPTWTTGNPIPKGTSFFAVDPQTLFQRRYYGDSTDPTVGKSALLVFPAADLDIDSTNTEGFAVPANNLSDDVAETNNAIGKNVPVSLGDIDHDGITDKDDLQIDGGHFVPLALRLSDNLSYAQANTYTVTFTYDTTKFRVWTKDASATRTSADILASGTVLTVGAGQSINLSAGGTAVFYLEAIATTIATNYLAVTAKVHVETSVWTGDLTDTVYAKPAPWIDALADTNNNGQVTPADQTDKDKASLPGKVIIADRLDATGDNKYGFGDGYPLDGSTDSSYSNKVNNFAPLQLTIPSGINLTGAKVQFTQSGSGLAALWSKDGSVSRSISDELLGGASGNTYTNTIDASTIFKSGATTATIYMEGVAAGTDGGLEITVNLLSSNGTTLGTDKIRITVASLQLVFTDASGLTHSDKNSSNPLNVNRIDRSQQPDGIATDWQAGVDDGSLLLVRAVGSPILQTLATHNQLQFAFGFVGKTIDSTVNTMQYRTLPGGNSIEGQYLAVSTLIGSLSSEIHTTTGQPLETGIANVDYTASSNLLVLASTIYRPPNEFDMVNGPNNTDQNRQLSLAVSLTGPITYAGAKPNDITLTRPPLVLVHGINPFAESPQQYWHTFIDKFSTLGYVSYTADHTDSFGMGATTIDYAAVPEAINAAVQGFRTGTAIDGLKIAVQKADIVAHSYGGILSRWYTEQASDGYGPRSLFDSRRDVRKIIELGTPNLGSPLANIIDAIAFDPTIGNAHAQIPLSIATILESSAAVIGYLDPPAGVLALGGLALTNYLQNNITLSQMVHILNFYGNLAFPSQDPSTGQPYPFFQDAAVDSALLDQLNDSTNSEQNDGPFNDDIAYGAIVGTQYNNALGGSLSPALSLYDALQPLANGGNLFPWLYQFSQDQNDSVVPIWSASLGLETAQVNTDHNDLTVSQSVFNDVSDWLSGFSLNGFYSPVPQGAAQRAAWKNTPPISERNAYMSGSTFDGTHTSGSGINPNSIVAVSFHGQSTTWNTDQSGAGIHEVDLTGMIQLGNESTGLDHFTIVSGDGQVLQNLGVVSLADLHINSMERIGAGVNDWVSFHITKGTIGRRFAEVLTGPDGDGSTIGHNQSVYYTLEDLPNGASPKSNLVLTPYFVPPPINTTGLTVVITGTVEVQDMTGKTLDLYLKQDSSFSEPVLWHQPIYSLSVPAGSWNGLLIWYSYGIKLFYGLDGNLAGPDGTSGTYPASLFEQVLQPNGESYVSSDISVS